MPNVMDTNGEECSLHDHDLVMSSPAGWKLVNALTGPEIVKLVKMAYAIPQFDAAQALKTFPSLKYTKPGRVEEVLAEVRANAELREQLGVA